MIDSFQGQATLFKALQRLAAPPKPPARSVVGVQVMVHTLCEILTHADLAGGLGELRALEELRTE